MNLVLEIAAVALNLIYLILLIRENITCWFFGIAGSLTSIYLFYSLGLYSESILYIYYVIIGIYGYSLWKKGNTDKPALRIGRINPKINLLIVCFGSLTAFGVGYIFASYTDANNPYLDAFTTVFSFVASFLEAKKIISSWIYWIFINAATIILYVQQELFIYLVLTIVYLVFSFIGFRTWKKSLQATVNNEA